MSGRGRAGGSGEWVGEGREAGGRAGGSGGDLASGQIRPSGVIGGGLWGGGGGGEGVRCDQE